MGPVETALVEARAGLTADNWHKGSYFATKDGHLCMCAHGAVQAIVNPACKKAVADNSVVGAETAAAPAIMASAAAAAVGAFQYRPIWVSRTDDTYGNLESHYVMGMAGLTAAFNDAPDTTLAMVKEKFTSAISIAHELGV